MVVEEERSPAPDPSATSASVTVLTIDERVSAGADLAQVVDQAPGANIRQLGGLGDFSAVSLRGSSLRQVQVYLDGVPLNPDGAQTVNLSELPLRAFSRVEVYRGNAPPELAAAPVGGVVNLVTADAGPGDARPNYNAGVTLGQWGTGRVDLGSRFDGAVGPFGQLPVDGLVLVEAFRTRGDFPAFSDTGTRYNVFDDHIAPRANNDKAQLSVHGRARVGDESLQLTVLGALLGRDEGLAGHVNTPTQQVSLRTLRNLSAVDLQARRGAARGRARMWWQHRDELYDDRAGELGVGNQWLESRFDTTGLSLTGAWAPTPQLLPSLTLTGRRDAYRATDRVQELEEGARLRHSASASGALAVRLWQDRVQLTPVLLFTALDNRLLGDVPFEDTAIAPDGQDTQLALDPRGGLLVRPLPWLALKANAGRYLRPPDFTELFGDRGGVVGNTDLVPERGWQWDAGVRLATPDDGWVSASVDAAWFHSSVTQQIVMVSNGQGISVPVNMGDTRTQGLELEASLGLFDVVDSHSSLTLSDSLNRSELAELMGNQLPGVPRLQVHQSTSLHVGERARLGHSWAWTDGNYWDATNFFLAAPRSVHSAFVRVQPFADVALSLELSGLNLTDTLVEVVDRNPLDDGDPGRVVQPITDFVGYPLPGRTWLLAMRWSG